MATTPTMHRPIPGAARGDMLRAGDPMSAVRRAVVALLPFRSGGPHGRAIAPARPSGVTPASPPAPAGGDQGIPHPWSPPPFATAWTHTGDAT